MTPLYAGVGGVVRELTEMDAGVNGVVKPMTEMWAGVDGVNRQIFSADTTAGSLSIGDVVQIKESGVAHDYLCVHQGLPSDIYDASCDGTWLLRKDIIEKMAWDASKSNKLEVSDIYGWLNSTMLARYDYDTRQAIKQVKIPYRKNGGSGGSNQTGENGLSCKVFLLSGYEVGWTTSVNQYFPVDGAKLSYFESGTGSSANNKRIAKLNGSATLWWLRSPHTSGTVGVWGVRSIGDYDGYSTVYTYGVRPCIILPKDFVL